MLHIPWVLFVMCTNVVSWNMLTMIDYRTKTLISALLVHYRLFYCLSAYFLKSPCTENQCIVHRYCHNITFYCGCKKHSQVIFLFYSYYACYDKRSFYKHLPLPISWFSMMLSSNSSNKIWFDYGTCALSWMPVINSTLTSLLNMVLFYGACQWMVVHLWKWISWKGASWVQRTCCFELVFFRFVFSLVSILLVNWPVVHWLMGISIRWHSFLFSIHLLFFASFVGQCSRSHLC